MRKYTCTLIVVNGRYLGPWKDLLILLNYGCYACVWVWCIIIVYMYMYVCMYECMYVCGLVSDILLHVHHVHWNVVIVYSDHPHMYDLRVSIIGVIVLLSLCVTVY